MHQNLCAKIGIFIVKKHPPPHQIFPPQQPPPSLTATYAPPPFCPLWHVVNIHFAHTQVFTVIIKPKYALQHAVAHVFQGYQQFVNNLWKRP